MTHSILIVDDERAIREELADFFASEEFSCSIAGNASEALALVEERDFAVVLLDLRLPDIDGVELLGRLREVAPESLVLLMTAHPSVDTVVSALRLGAIDYVLKPLILDDILNKVKRLIEFQEQQRELLWYRKQIHAENEPANIVGNSEPMRDVYRLVERVAQTATPVLITGESGTGKELIARAIHHKGMRGDKAFIALNCAAVPAGLLESQLFGHLKGAFTGAEAQAEGLFRAASGGTLFLDEIGELPLELQPKLLRAIEEQVVLPVGATRPLKVDARIIASTNRNLEEAVQGGHFRKDLYFRVAVVTITMPPLRDRAEDIPALVESFLNRLNKKLQRRCKGVTNETLRRLVRYKWKGNIRELQNVLERAMILEESDLITPASLPSNLVQATHPKEATGPLKEAVREFEREYIGRILRATGDDKQLAAELLGVSVSSIYRRLQTFEEQLDAANGEGSTSTRL